MGSAVKCGDLGTISTDGSALPNPRRHVMHAHSLPSARVEQARCEPGLYPKTVSLPQLALIPEIPPKLAPFLWVKAKPSSRVSMTLILRSLLWRFNICWGPHRHCLHARHRMSGPIPGPRETQSSREGSRGNKI